MAAMSSLILGGMALTQAYTASEAAKSQGDYQNSIAKTNAMLADEQGKDAIARGEHASLVAQGEAKKLEGAQRAAQAASGIDITSGSAAEVRAETSFLGAQDAQTIRNNAWREAWGYQAQARDYRQQGRMAVMAADNESRNTLLSGGIKAFGYATMKGDGNDTKDTRAGSTRTGSGSGPRVRPSNDY